MQVVGRMAASLGMAGGLEMAADLKKIAVAGS